jgi:hypothetical protein
MMNMSHGDFGESVVTTSTFKSFMMHNDSVLGKGNRLAYDGCPGSWW